MVRVCTLSVLVLHETFLVPVLIYGSETMLCKERSRIRAVQVNNLRGLLGIRKTDKSPECMDIREFCGLMKVFSGGLTI